MSGPRAGDSSPDRELPGGEHMRKQRSNREKQEGEGAMALKIRVLTRIVTAQRQAHYPMKATSSSLGHFLNGVCCQRHPSEQRHQYGHYRGE